MCIISAHLIVIIALAGAAVGVGTVSPVSAADKQAIRHGELVFELPGPDWQRSENGDFLQYSRTYRENRGQSVSIWPASVPPALRGLSEPEHAAEYFAFERRLPRYDARWYAFEERHRQIAGVRYAVMGFRIEFLAAQPPRQAEGLFLLYFPPDFQRSQRFYVVMAMDVHPPGSRGLGLDFVDDVVATLRVESVE